MNQILDYNPNKSSGGGSSGSDKVIRVFALILICFAICLVAIGGYNLMKNKEKETSTVPSATLAKISVEKKENVVAIQVSHDKVIQKIIYNWDSQKETTLPGKNTSTMEEEIPLLAGSHTLNIKVVDIDGVESVYEETIESETGEDQIFPVIDLKVTDEKKLKITATDETEISYVTYRWNDEEEIRVDVSDEDKKKIEFEIDIYKGKNDIVIVAVDANNKVTTETESFTGVTKPDITVTISADKRTVDIKCYHENGIKEVELNINGTDFDVDLEGETPTDVDLNDVELAEGDNIVKVSARSVDDTITEVTEEVKSDPIEDEINLSIADDGTVIVNVPTGIREMKLNLNEMDYDIDLGSENPVDITINKEDIPFMEGNNKLTIKVVGFNGTKKEETKEIHYQAE
ncbi:MAG: hypothetical protein IKL55_03840 [Clostridia bacterium]|nr:hypothetical protein [Clostridia bacterium]